MDKLTELRYNVNKHLLSFHSSRSLIFPPFAITVSKVSLIFIWNVYMKGVLPTQGLIRVHTCSQ